MSPLIVKYGIKIRIVYFSNHLNRMPKRSNAGLKNPDYIAGLCEDVKFPPLLMSM